MQIAPKLTSKKLLKGNVALFIFVAIIVFLTRLPFIDAGYGRDADAWRVVRVAQAIDETGEYEASRFPGYPLPEYLYSLVWEHGPTGANLITALLSALGVAIFTLSLKELGLKDYLLTGIVLAFIPVVFVNSTNAMDYVWAMTFMLGGLYFVIIHRYFVAGLFVGLAIGTRITSGAILIPLTFLILMQNRWRINLSHSLQLFIPALAVGALAFLPVFLKYDLGFFTFYEPRQALALTRVLLTLSVNVWGTIGSLAVAIAMLALIGRSIAQRDFRWGSKKALSIHPSVGWVWLAAVAIYLAAFFRLPMDAGYLIPTVPFVLLIFAGSLPRRFLRVVVLMLLISPILLNLERSGIDVKGPILVNYDRRISDLHYADDIIAVLQAEKFRKTVLVAGPFVEILKNMGRSAGLPEQIRLVYFLDKYELERYLDSDYTVYYLPRTVTGNKRAHGLDLRNTPAIPLIVD